MIESISLSELVDVRRHLIDPRLYPKETFYYYSMPAFDEYGQPEVVLGSQIDSSKFIIESDALLISKLNPRIKRVWRVQNDGLLRSICSTEFVDVVPKNLQTTDFLFQLLLSDNIYRILERNAEGTTNSHVRYKPSLLVNITLDSGPEKQDWPYIANALSSLDRQIEQTETLIAKYQQIKAGLMQDLFTRGVTPDGHLRPTRTQAPHLYKDSLLGWIPKEWEVKRLGVILKECGGYLQTGPFGSQLHAHEYEHEGVPVVMPQDINDGVISIDQIARIVERKAEELFRHRMRVGDVVIARRGELSRAAAIDDSHEGWLCGTGCFVLRLGRNALHSDFAACVYRHDLIQRQIAGVAVGTTMPSLNNTVMERLFFPLCDPEEQLRITERLDNFDQLLWFTQSRVSKLRQQKQGLMQDLLTGRVRVKVAESEKTA